MTQPAVTFQIRALEDYFNIKLFRRTGNKIALTRAGEEVSTYAEQILDLYNEMDCAVRNRSGRNIGVLLIGASTTIGEYKIPKLLGEFQKNFSDGKLRLKVSNTVSIVHMLDTNDIDIGIVEGPVNNKNLMAKVCWRDQIMVICPPNHALASARSIKIDQVLPYPIIIREEGSGTREVISDYMEQHGLGLGDLQTTMELGSPESIKSVVKAGLGISFISETTLEKELKLGSLRAIPLDPPLLRPFSIVYKRQQFRLRAMQEFLDFIEMYCDDCEGDTV